MTVQTGYEDDVSERGRRAIGYVRVASISQGDPTSALDAQAAHIKATAMAEGLELIGIVEDSRKSALDMNREGLNGILAAAAARRFDVIIVRDRAGRLPSIGWKPDSSRVLRHPERI